MKQPGEWHYTMIVTCLSCHAEVWRKRTYKANEDRYVTEIRQAFLEHALRLGHNLHMMRLLGDKVWSTSVWHRSVYWAPLDLYPSAEELDAARTGRPYQDSDGYCCCCGLRGCNCQGICFPCDNGYGQHCPAHCQHAINIAIEVAMETLRQAKSEEHEQGK